MSKKQSGKQTVVEGLPLKIYNEERDGDLHRIEEGSTCENVCLQIGQKLEISPTMLHCFGLQKIRKSSKVSTWLSPMEELRYPSEPEEIHFRMRFMPICVKETGYFDTQSNHPVDTKCFRYLYWQIYWDFLHDKIVYNWYDAEAKKVQRGLTVLGVVIQMRQHTELCSSPTDSSYIENLKSFLKSSHRKFKSFFPSSIVRPFSLERFTLKKHLMDRVRQYQGIYPWDDPQYNSLELMKLFMLCIISEGKYFFCELYPVYSVQFDTQPVPGKPDKMVYKRKEKVNVIIDMGRAPAELFIDRQTENRVIQISRLSSLRLEEDQTCKMFKVQLVPTDSPPEVLHFDEKHVAESFVTCLEGYYRICFNYYQSLCKPLEPRAVRDINLVKAHGPVSTGYVKQKLEKHIKDNGNKSCYALYKSLTDHDVFELVRNVKGSKTLKVASLGKLISTKDGYSFGSSTHRSMDLRKLMDDKIQKMEGLQPGKCLKIQPKFEGCDVLQEIFETQEELKIPDEKSGAGTSGDSAREETPTPIVEESKPAETAVEKEKEAADEVSEERDAGKDIKEESDVNNEEEKEEESGEKESSPETVAGISGDSAREETPTKIVEESKPAETAVEKEKEAADEVSEEWDAREDIKEELDVSSKSKEEESEEKESSPEPGAGTSGDSAREKTPTPVVEEYKPAETLVEKEEESADEVSEEWDAGGDIKEESDVSIEEEEEEESKEKESSPETGAGTSGDSGREETPTPIVEEYKPAETLAEKEKEAADEVSEERDAGEDIKEELDVSIEESEEKEYSPETGAGISGDSAREETPTQIVEEYKPAETLVEKEKEAADEVSEEWDAGEDIKEEANVSSGEEEEEESEEKESSPETGAGISGDSAREETPTQIVEEYKPAETLVEKEKEAADEVSEEWDAGEDIKEEANVSSEEEEEEESEEKESSPETGAGTIGDSVREETPTPIVEESKPAETAVEKEKEAADKVSEEQDAGEDIKEELDVSSKEEEEEESEEKESSLETGCDVLQEIFETQEELRIPEEDEKEAVRRLELENQPKVFMKNEVEAKKYIGNFQTLHKNQPKVFMKNEVEAKKYIGKGFFTEVYQAQLHNGETVIMKRLRRDEIIERLDRKPGNSAEILSQLEEAFEEGFDTLLKLNNPKYFLNCVGVSGQTKLLKEEKFGNLKYFLETIPTSRYAHQLTMHHLLAVTIQLADALEYMKTEKCFHGNLHCGNIIVTKFIRHEMLVKITDPGMVHYYNKLFLDTVCNRNRLPWIAPELYENLQTCTIQSEIYSYGMTLWQMYNEGQSPCDYAILMSKSVPEICEFFTNEQPSCPLSLKPCNDDSKTIKQIKKHMLNTIYKCCMVNQKDRLSPKEILKDLHGNMQKSGQEYHDYNIKFEGDSRSGGAKSGQGTGDTSGIVSYSQPLPVPINDTQRFSQNVNEREKPKTGRTSGLEIPVPTLEPGCELANKDQPAEMVFSVHPARLKTHQAPSMVLSWEPIVSDVKFIIPEGKLSIDKKIIGSGRFGKVLSGTYKGQKVAVKMCIDETYRSRFEREYEILASLQHRHIVNLVGIYRLPEINGHGIVYVMEHMGQGSLLSLLKRSKKQNNPLSVQQKNELLIQVGEGMAYLFSHNCLHCDLKADNVLLNDEMIAKISDFGLAKRLDGEEVYDSYTRSGGLIKLNISAPETMKDKKINTYSDIWSYGVLCIEVFLNGQEPNFVEPVNFKDMISSGNCSLLYKKIKAGERFQKPVECPEVLYQVVLRCWDLDPKKRILYRDIIKNFKHMTNSVAEEQLFIMSNIPFGQNVCKSLLLLLHQNVSAGGKELNQCLKRSNS